MRRSRAAFRRGLLIAVAAVTLLIVLGEERAEAVPSVTFECTPAPADCSGWYRSNVSIDWTVLPSNATVLAGCQDKTLTTDTTGTSEFCSARDGSTLTLEVPIKIDKTPPLVLRGDPARGADVNGWYNHPLTVTFSGSDQTSGIQGCTAPTYNGPDSGTASLSGTCVDKAGNVSSPLGYGLKYDASAPSVTGAKPERAANANGWFNRSVVFDFQGTDGASGIESCTRLTYNGPETDAGSFSGSCRDWAGNSSSARSFPIKYDATAPVAGGGQPRRGPDRNGWYNDPVTIDFSGSDQLSGLQSCTTTTYSGPDAGSVLVPGTCTDRAGNVSGPASVPLRYDNTAPHVTAGEPARGPDVNGWYNQPLTVTFKGSDGMSGLDACTKSIYSGPDSSTASVSGTCMDRAGNVSGPLAFGFGYDATAPAVAGAAPDRGPNAEGWFNRSVRFDLQASDPISGVADCPPVTYAGPDSANASFNATCRDWAGNTRNRSFFLKYDATAPEATKATADPPANAAGWHNEPVTVTFGGSDGTSGVAVCTKRTYSGPDAGATTVTGTCTDRAGNPSAPLGFGLRYDTAPPAIDKSQPGRPADANGWYNEPVTIEFGGTDALSGVHACTAKTYDGPDTAGASVSGTCTDLAGNSAGPLSVGFKYDATPPQVMSASAARVPDTPNGWYTQPVTFEFEGDDATSGIEACPAVVYAGPDGATAQVVGQCRDRAANVASRAFGLRFDSNAPPIMDLAAAAADHSVAVSWRTTADAESVGVKRTPGFGFEATSSVFGGPGTSFVDTQVENGVRYAYQVRVQDSAGNARSETVTAVPTASPVVLEAGTASADASTAAGSGQGLALSGFGPATPARRAGGLRLIAPPAGAVVRAGRPLRLQWTPVPRASYYNLQLFRDGKILTAWPSKPHYRLEPRWRYRGKRYRLGPGRYHWIVWPGFGPRAKADYGRRIGRRAFEVRAANR
jgi:large repetitive protein